MESWVGKSKATKEALSLSSEPIGYQRFEKAVELDDVTDVM
jgi:hypothetical protein